jgi:hypothetical protein
MRITTLIREATSTPHRVMGRIEDTAALAARCVFLDAAEPHA